MITTSSSLVIESSDFTLKIMGSSLFTDGLRTYRLMSILYSPNKKNMISDSHLIFEDWWNNYVIWHAIEAIQVHV